jgi:hypothetical protein
MDLTAPFELTYTYRRSTGPILGAFFTALGEGRLLGARCADGRVLMPPAEADPTTGRDVEGLVDVGPEGTVICAAHPPSAPEGHPGGWALIQLDGATTGLLHRVFGPAAAGARVRARFQTPATGTYADLEGFEVIA